MTLAKSLMSLDHSCTRISTRTGCCPVPPYLRQDTVQGCSCANHKQRTRLYCHIPCCGWTSVSSVCYISFRSCTRLIPGWSRSAAFGQSVWDAPSNRHRSPSAASSTLASPADSDNEEYDSDADVDYDDVLAVIDTRKHYSGPGSPRGGKRGRGGAGRSYQDLTSVRSPRADPTSGPSSPSGEFATLHGESNGREEKYTKLTMRKREKEVEKARRDGEEEGLGLGGVANDKPKKD